MGVQEFLATINYRLRIKDELDFSSADFMKRIDRLQLSLPLSNRHAVSLESRHLLTIDDVRELVGQRVHHLLAINNDLNYQSEPYFYAGSSGGGHVVAVGLGKRRVGFTLRGPSGPFSVLQTRLSPGVWSTLTSFGIGDWEGMDEYISFGETLVNGSRPS